MKTIKKCCHCCFCYHNWANIRFNETKAKNLVLRKDLLKTGRESPSSMGEMVLRQWDDVQAPSSPSWSFQQYGVACSAMTVTEVANHGSHKSLLVMYSVIFFCKFLLWEGSHIFFSSITQVLTNLDTYSSFTTFSCPWVMIPWPGVCAGPWNI